MVSAALYRTVTRTGPLFFSWPNFRSISVGQRGTQPQHCSGRALTQTLVRHIICQVAAVCASYRGLSVLGVQGPSDTGCLHSAEWVDKGAQSLVGMRRGAASWLSCLSRGHSAAVPPGPSP